MKTEHIPVLKTEILNILNLQPGDNVIDLTVGGGGHAQAILTTTAPNGQLIGFDADPETLEFVRDRLKPFGSRVHLFHKNFIDCTQIIHECFNSLPISGILLDLGLSSLALGSEYSRFSFLSQGPLDFRFDPTSQGITAAELINRLSEKELAQIIRQYGEEPQAKKIAQAIVSIRKDQPFQEISQLTNLLVDILPKRKYYGRSRIHPATKTFQALRIAVNDELGVLERVLPVSIELLAPGGRVAVLSYHSLEDRIVKRYFKQESKDCLCPADQPTCTCRHHASLQVLTKKPITPPLEEQSANPRSRSAKLRAAEKNK
ncbi:MAG: 16S rRNA (cytosine(1402)-N(4))-methyltransferase RsmH [bacterium]